MPKFLIFGLARAIEQILENQEEILRLLRRGHLSPEDRQVLERAVRKLEALAREH